MASASIAAFYFHGSCKRVLRALDCFDHVDERGPVYRYWWIHLGST